MALTNFRKDEVPEGKSDLLCSVDGCRSLWSVRLEGSSPKCSFHQWQNKPKSEGTSSYKQWADRQPLTKPVADWYKQPDEKW